MTGSNEWVKEYKNVTRSFFSIFLIFYVMAGIQKEEKVTAFSSLRTTLIMPPKKPNGHFWIQN